MICDQNNSDLIRLIAGNNIWGVEEGLKIEKIELRPDKKARVITLLYELYSKDKKVDKATVIKYIRLAV